MSDLETARRCAQRMYANDQASHELGIVVEIPEAYVAVARMQVRDNMLNGFGICHGGMIFSLADTAFAFACNADNQVTVAAFATIDFLRPAHGNDELVARAERRCSDRRNGFYSVTVHNQNNELVAVFQGRSRSTDKTMPD